MLYQEGCVNKNEKKNKYHHQRPYQKALPQHGKRSEVTWEKNVKLIIDMLVKDLGRVESIDPSLEKPFTEVKLVIY